ncbi:coiled-coil domain-containing protein 24 isoform X1 [Phyllopteryx taeniolatus]|uniref:coiled-coil domain-containing protein 24 isoform X1 n=1 Tax=Phyllopteryx taeniolatus TaxID=161469 RepID=UPI002AD41B85|nr:coiled-coil domain-containing protein 24 isoform X1 [Phyllopteryx taeniolatus]XP_061653650.1 coiled-coil domain-containing protein 24 isoform X1 [Phyllopteryx taeniolatus]
MQSSSGNQTGCPAPSLWSLIVEHVPRSEMPKIHATLGRSLVDTYTELHAEAVMWHKIWQDSLRAGAPLSRSRGPLADPPVIKELVRAEVRMLLESLQEKFFREGRHDEELLSRYNAKTVNFALGRLDIGAEPKDELSSSASVQSSVQVEIEAMKDNLNITDINKVVQHLKSILSEECAALKAQVKHTQELIKKQCRSQDDGVNSEPTLADLKELRGAIQKDLELYPSPPSHVAEKATRQTFRLSTGQKNSDKTLYTITSTSLRRPHPPSAPPHFNFCGSLKPIDALETTSRTSHQHKSATSASRHRKVRLKTTASDPVVMETLRPEEDNSDFLWRLLTTADSSPFFPTQYLQPG